MIENKNLTPEQIERFPEFVEKWSQIWLSTTPADRPKAEHGIRAIYETAGLKPPKVVWCSSPLASGLVRAIIQQFSQLASASYNELVNIRRYNLSRSPGESNAGSVIDRIRTNTRDSITGSVGENTWRNVIASIEDSADARIDQIKPGVEDCIGDHVLKQIIQPVVSASVDVPYNIWCNDDE